MSSTSVLKRIKTETKADVEVTNIDSMTGSSTITSKLSCPQDPGSTFIHVFNEDILPEIFDNLDILTVKDLFNFRLVNRCWRNAASFILLKRNLGMIHLSFGTVTLDEDCNTVDLFGTSKNNPSKNIFGNTTPSCNYFNYYRPKSVLSELSKLIITSPKFPCNHIYFSPTCSYYGLKNLNPLSDCDNFEAHADADQPQQDLFQFLSLYGKKIKKLSLGRDITKEAVQNLLYVHMPQLTCLDLENFGQFSTEDKTLEETPKKICLSPPSKNLNSKSILKLEELIIGYNLREAGKPNVGKLKFVEELLNVSPNLSAIQYVDVSALGVLLKMGKSHLIQSLYMDPTPGQMSIVEEFARALSNARNNLVSLPVLRKFNVQFNNFWEGNDYDMCNEALLDTSRVLNLILSANKNSLKGLELSMNPSSNIYVNIFIPPLPRLKYLRLIDNERTFLTGIHFLGDIIGRGIQDWKATADQLVTNFGAIPFQNQTNCSIPVFIFPFQYIPADYFPCLSKVSLKIREFGNNSDNERDFFSLEHMGSGGSTIIPGDTLLTVTTLELIAYSPFDRNLSKLFPNVSSLSIYSDSTSILQNWLWNSFPKLERLELFTMINEWDTMEVDSFFTGISPEISAKFDGEKDITGCKSGSAQDLLERTQPYIGDCKNLKKFRINFWKHITSMFATKLSVDHGFQDVVHRAKIIFSFEDMQMSVDKINETLRYLDPIAAHVEIKMKK